jgi:hypothetical protein
MRQPPFHHCAMPQLPWLCLAVASLLPSLACAWGGEGHQVVALIAEERLTPKASAAIHELLGEDVHISDAEVASWADQIKRERRRTSPWHYTNIPIGSFGYDKVRDGNDGNDIVRRIESFKALLADKTQTPEARAEALKFLVHLVGDLHQPLHCAERQGDRGGNGRLCFVLEAKGRATSLHTVWDTTLLRRMIGRTRIAEFSEKLNDAISEEDEKAWTSGSIIDWANESWRVAGEKVYTSVPVDGPPPVLDQPYVDVATPVIEDRLKRGGVRLATVLNEALDR